MQSSKDVNFVNGVCPCYLSQTLSHPSFTTVISVKDCWKNKGSWSVGHISLNPGVCFRWLTLEHDRSCCYVPRRKLHLLFPVLTTLCMLGINWCVFLSYMLGINWCVFLPYMPGINWCVFLSYMLGINWCVFLSYMPGINWCVFLSFMPGINWCVFLFYPRYKTRVLRKLRSVKRFALGSTIRESTPGGGETFRTCPDWPWDPRGFL